MDTWLTETGVVEITLPSGKTVKLESIKALQELIEKTSKTVGDKFDKNSVVQAIGRATDKVMSQKEIIDGKPNYYTDGEQVDIPMSTWLDVRVEMPPNSVWYQKQHSIKQD